MARIAFDTWRAFAMERFAWDFLTYHPIPIQWPNSEFAEPKNAPWGVFNFIDGDPFPASVGSGRVNRYVGIIQIDVLVPEDTDMVAGMDMAETAAQVYADKTFTIEPGHYVRFKTGKIEAVGRQNGSYRFMARVPFQRDVKQ